MNDTPAPPRCVAITCMRDDGSYILEWLAHHIPRGFDHFLILTHDCTDGTPALLNALAAAGIVTHVPFQRRGKATAQWQALKLARAHPLLETTDWALFFDCDEFLWLPPDLPTIQHLLAAFEAQSGPFDALTIPWRFYGAGGAQAREEGLTPERFVAAAPPDLHFPMAHLFKSLIRPACFDKLGVHRPKRHSGPGLPRWLAADGTPLPPIFARQSARISLYGTPRGQDRIGLNHYSLRSVEEFLVKRQRGLPNHMDRQIGLDYWVERNWNTVQDTRLLPMLDATRATLAELLSLPGVHEAHQACHAAYAKRAQQVRDNLDTLRLAWQIGLLAENRPPSPEQAALYIRDQLSIRDRDGAANQP
ncbi:MAG: glycosyltransferase family 2 protein [Ruegeria sp.]|uniref:glycosyltransferase family 2 protein n=1 Tax=Ruegeria sp. TaxID=1879320 RepID=UPI00349F0430